MGSKRERSLEDDSLNPPRHLKRPRRAPLPSPISHLSPSLSSLPSPSSPPHDHLTALSDELLVRIFHLLSLSSVLTIQRVSHRFQRLARDGQVWKGLYYERFVRPRVRRLRAGGAAGGGRSVEWDFASRDARWLDELVDSGSGSGSKRGEQDDEGIDWKKRFKLRFNWSRGSAVVRNIGLGGGGADNEDTELDTASDTEVRSRQEPCVGYVSETDPRFRDRQKKGQVMVKLVNGIVVTADADEGLRAWDVKSANTGKECLAKLGLHGSTAGDTPQPTCIAVDTILDTNMIDVVVGFDNGGFGIWRLTTTNDSTQTSELMMFSEMFRRESGQGTSQLKSLSAVAFAHPYLLTSTEDQVLSLYTFEERVVATSNAELQDSVTGDEELTPLMRHQPDRPALQYYKPPRLLASLKSHTSWPPISLSIRPAPRYIIASIAYALPTYLNGWSVGLQELHLSKAGEILHSRLATAVEAGFHSLLSSTPARAASTTPPPSPKTDGRGLGVSASASSRPTNLSYTHPYLLATHADNTLTLYLVISNDEDLKIGNGTKLWGHTSGVVGAMIGGKGRAVSVGGVGGEVRVWELEGGISRGRKGAAGERSIRVEGKSSSSADERSFHEMSHERKGWVGFDDELVVVMRGLDGGDTGGGGERLVVYDFT